MANRSRKSVLAVWFGDEVFSELLKKVPQGKRSAFIREATKEKLAKLKTQVWEPKNE